MKDGRIHYAERSGNYYLKFSGDVRVTLCTGLNVYIERIFEEDNVQSVVVDLSEAEAVDSTTLGLLAKIALYTDDQQQIKPIMIVRDPSMLRLVESMGFDEIFELMETVPDSPKRLKELPCSSATTDVARDQVIEAHRVLMGMNESNMNTFSELVKALETEADSSSDTHT